MRLWFFELCLIMIHAALVQPSPYCRYSPFACSKPPPSICSVWSTLPTWSSTVCPCIALPLVPASHSRLFGPACPQPSRGIFPLYSTLHAGDNTGFHVSVFSPFVPKIGPGRLVTFKFSPPAYPLYFWPTLLLLPSLCLSSIFLYLVPPLRFTRNSFRPLY